MTIPAAGAAPVCGGCGERWYYLQSIGRATCLCADVQAAVVVPPGGGPENDSSDSDLFQRLCSNSEPPAVTPSPLAASVPNGEGELPCREGGRGVQTATSSLVETRAEYL